MLSSFSLKWSDVVFVEAFGAAFLVFCYFAVTNHKNKFVGRGGAKGLVVPLVVGAVYAIMVATIGPLTGAAINPGTNEEMRFSVV